MHTLMMNKQFTSEYVLRDDIQSADLIYGDPTNGKTEMDISKYTHEKTGSTALFDYSLQSNQNLSAYVMGLN